MLVVLVVVSSTACHRVTGVAREASGVRHAMGVEAASEATVWLGLAGVLAGTVSLFVTGFRPGPAGSAAWWSTVLLIIGFATMFGGWWAGFGFDS